MWTVPTRFACKKTPCIHMLMTPKLFLMVTFLIVCCPLTRVLSFSSWLADKENQIHTESRLDNLSGSPSSWPGGKEKLQHFLVLFLVVVGGSWAVGGKSRGSSRSLLWVSTLFLFRVGPWYVHMDHTVCATRPYEIRRHCAPLLKSVIACVLRALQ